MASGQHPLPVVRIRRVPIRRVNEPRLGLEEGWGWGLWIRMVIMGAGLSRREGLDREEWGSVRAGAIEWGMWVRNGQLWKGEDR